MAGIRVVADSACDLPPAIAAELGIEIVPLTIRFGTTELVDGKDLTPQEFWARCASFADNMVVMWKFLLANSKFSDSDNQPCRATPPGKSVSHHFLAKKMM